MQASKALKAVADHCPRAGFFLVPTNKPEPAEQTVRARVERLRRLAEPISIELRLEVDTEIDHTLDAVSLEILLQNLGLDAPVSCPPQIPGHP